jgi:hypothetical protein
MGSNVLEHGRPCFSRISLLVEHRQGFLLGFDLSMATLPLSQSVGCGLIKTLLKNGFLPETILIDDIKLKGILTQLCDTLNINLELVEGLEFLMEAMDSVVNYTKMGK